MDDNKNENKEDIKSVKKHSIFLLIIALLVVGGFVSYALVVYNFDLKGDKVNKITSCGVDINVDEDNPINLVAAIPMDDSAIGKYDPYTFTVSNNNSGCDNVFYNIKMVDYCSTCTQENGVCTEGGTSCNCNEDHKINSNLIKYRVVNKKTNEVITGIDPFNNFNLSGGFDSKTDSISYEIKVWISSSATNDDIYVKGTDGNYLTDANGAYVTKNFCSKLRLEVGDTDTIPTNRYTEGMLGYAILGGPTKSKVSTTEGDTGLFESIATNNGTPTYYYKGNVDNNYVTFANQNWRIIRVNEDGTIRMILEEKINNTTYAFNPTYNEFKYMYYSNSNATNRIKKTVDDWYSANIGNNPTLANKVATGTFCEQAKVKKNSDFTSGGATMDVAANYTPDFKCAGDGNFKADGTEYGPLQMKVGLITIDEVIHAGIPLDTGSQTNNTNTYLQKSYYWWTMSPAGFYNFARAWSVRSDGSANYYYVSDLNGVRPVINLNADALADGTGTSGDPYVIK